jgi:hypothetical protein
MEKDELIRLLEQLNGVYIPGDTKQTYLDSGFLETVSKILFWAQEHNSEEGKHFPIVATGYGFTAML